MPLRGILFKKKPLDESYGVKNMVLKLLLTLSNSFISSGQIPTLTSYKSQTKRNAVFLENGGKIKSLQSIYDN